MVIVGSIINEDAPAPPPFLSWYVIYLCQSTTSSWGESMWDTLACSMGHCQEEKKRIFVRFSGSWRHEIWTCDITASCITTTEKIHSIFKVNKTHKRQCSLRWQIKVHFARGHAGEKFNWLLRNGLSSPHPCYGFQRYNTISILIHFWSRFNLYSLVYLLGKIKWWRLWRYVAYYWMFVAYDACFLIMVVALWRLSPYDV